MSMTFCMLCGRELRDDRSWWKRLWSPHGLPMCTAYYRDRPSLVACYQALRKRMGLPPATDTEMDIVMRRQNR